MDVKSRDYYIDNIVPGNIVAFRVEDRMYTGKIYSIEEGSYTIKTKNASVYHVEKDRIVWVKNGSHWPQSIYEALKLNSR